MEVQIQNARIICRVNNNYLAAFSLNQSIFHSISQLLTMAAKSARRVFIILNNDTEVITENWLTLMVSFAQQERIGCGAKLLYPNNTVQHAGVILGLGGVAGHGHLWLSGDLGYFGRLAINVNYSAVTAACLLMKKQILMQLVVLKKRLP